VQSKIEELAKDLKISEGIQLIESYDISHTEEIMLLQVVLFFQKKVKREVSIDLII
jgi:excinuclease UvrABC nuclease subunit